MTPDQQQRLAQLLDRLEVLLCRVEVAVGRIVADERFTDRPKPN